MTIFQRKKDKILFICQCLKDGMFVFPYKAPKHLWIGNDVIGFQEFVEEFEPTNEKAEALFEKVLKKTLVETNDDDTVC